MKRLVLLVVLLLAGGIPLFAQNDAIQGHCTLGGTKAITSGMTSTNYANGIIPGCQVTVYLTGTTTLATIYSNATGTPLPNPFTAIQLPSPNAGYWIFFAATGQGYDVKLSGGNGNPSCTTAPNCYTTPLTYTDLKVGGSGSGGSGLTFFSAGNLNPLFNTNVANPGTTPNLTFSQQNAVANTLFGNFTGSSGPPFFAKYTCAGLLNCSYDIPSNTWTLNVPSTTALSITTTNPIKVNGGNGPIASGTANISCDGCGVPQVRMNPGEDATHVFVPFTACDFTVDNLSLLVAGSGCSSNGMAASFYAGGLFNHNINTTTTWSGAALPSWLPPGNVVSVQLIAYSGGFGAGPVANCGGSGSCPSWAFPPTNQQVAVPVSGVTGSNIGSLTAVAYFNKSLYCVGCASPITVTDLLGVYGIGLLVEYSGVTNPNPNNALNVNWPLLYDKGSNSLGVSPFYPFQISPMLTAYLPSPSALGTLAWVSDNTQTTPGGTCTGSGTAGSDYAICINTQYGYKLLTDMGGSGFGVSSVSSADGTLTVSPGTGHVNVALNRSSANHWLVRQDFDVGLDLGGANAPLYLNSGTGSSGDCLISSGGGATPHWGSCGGGGGGGISGSGTTGFFPKFTSSTAVGNSHIDDGVTTASTITSSEAIAVSDGSGSGKVTLNGSTSGSAAISVPAVAGSTSTILLPTTDPTNGQVLTAGTPSGGNVQTSWTSAGGSLNVNGSPVSSPNLQNSGSVTFSVSGSNIQATALGGTGLPTGWVSLAASPYNGSSLPVAYCNATSGSNVLTNCTNTSSFVSNQGGVWFTYIESNVSNQPLTGVLCDHFTISGSSITMLTSGGGACNSTFTTTSTGMPVYHTYTVKGYGAASTNTLTLTATDSTFTTGMGIRVVGAGASGADLVCPYISISGTAVSMYTNSGLSAPCNIGTTISSGSPAQVWHEDTQALQSAVSSGSNVNMPPGSYYIGSEVDITTPMILQGSGRFQSTFVVTKNAINAIVAKTSGFLLTQFGVNQVGTFTPTSGSLLSFCDGSAQCTEAAIRGLYLNGGWTQITVNNKSIQGWIQDNTGVNAVHAGIYINNPQPFGDMNITDNQFNNCNTAGCNTATGLLIDAADREVIAHNKFNEFQTNLHITGSTGGIFNQSFIGNSFEKAGNVSNGDINVLIEKLAGNAVQTISFTGDELSTFANSTGGKVLQIGTGVKGVTTSNIQVVGNVNTNDGINILSGPHNIDAKVGGFTNGIVVGSSLSGIKVTGQITNNSGFGLQVGANTFITATGGVYSSNTSGNMSIATPADASTFGNTCDDSTCGAVVTQLLAGTNIALSPSGGTGAVTVSYTSSGGGPYPTPVTAVASSSSALQFTTCLSSSYNNYQLIFRGIVTSVDAAKLSIKFSTDGGSTYLSSGYSWYALQSFVGGSNTFGSTSDSALTVINSQSSTATKGAGGYITLTDMNSTSGWKRGVGQFTNWTEVGAGGLSTWNVGGEIQTTTAINAIEVVPSSGNITSGSVTCQPIPQ